MPLVRVSLREGKPPSYLSAIGESIHQAMIETITIPKDDRFQIFTEHPADGLIYDPSYLGIARTDDIVIVQITLNSGRTLDQKRALYRAIADRLARDPGVRKEDVLVNLVEVSKDCWSFGNGEASYAK
jgi:phenylpyruvate tautomerase PptA (4-oxalocrotonate tautomerase family)